MASVDYNIRSELSDVIEDLTTSGEPSLDPSLIKKVKNICKKSDDYVKHAYHMVFSQLRKHHAQIRLSCVLIVNELFMRSHSFRELLLKDFQRFLELTVETNPQDEPLPAPENVAQSLKMKTLEAVQKWHEKFGSFYKKLDLGYNFLKRSKKVNFHDMTVRSTAERQLAEEKEIRRQNAWMKKMKKVENEIKETESEMELCMTEVENCFRLLLPHPDSFENLFSADIFDIPHSSKQETQSSMINNKGYQSTVASRMPQLHYDQSFGHENSSLKPFDDTNVVANRTSMLNIGNTQDCIRHEVDINKSEPNSGLKLDEEIIKTRENVLEKVMVAMEENEVDKKAEMGETELDKVKVSLEENQLADKVKIGIGENEFDNIEMGGNGVDKEETVVDETGNKPVKTLKKNIPTEELEENDDDDECDDEDGFETEDEQNLTEYDERSQLVSQHGLALQTYQLSIKINSDNPDIHENDDNTDIINNLREMHQQILQKYIPMVSNWLKILSKGESEQGLVKKIINLKMSLETTRDKCTELKIDMSPQKRSQNINVAESSGNCVSDDDDEFEDVPEKEGFEEFVPAHLRAEYGLEPLEKPKPTLNQPKHQPKLVQPSTTKIPAKRTCPDWMPVVTSNTHRDIDDPTSFATALTKYQEKVSKTLQTKKAVPDNKLMVTGHALKCSSQDTTASNPQHHSTPSNLSDEKDENRKKLLEQAPVVPYGLDLQYWDKPMETPLVVKFTSLEKFWLPKEYENEEFVPEDTMNAFKTRTMKFTGEFEPVKWMCRAPLPSGKLCPRRDRYRCPLHGRVIPRNEDGSLASQSETKKEQVAMPDGQKDEEDWRTIQHEVEAALGLDLGGRRKSRKKTKKDSKTSDKTKNRYKRLTNLKICDTSRTRLENKVMSKNSLKRVAQEMDVIASKRFKDKFGNNFNYSLNP